MQMNQSVSKICQDAPFLIKNSGKSGKIKNIRFQKIQTSIKNVKFMFK